MATSEVTAESSSAAIAAETASSVESRAEPRVIAPALEEHKNTIGTETGPRKTPFEHPSSNAHIPAPQELTPEQASKYNTAHSTCSSWTKIATSSAPKAEQTSITDGERMWLTRECILRYLRASKWDVKMAEGRLMATLVWRREYGIQKITPDYISIESETGKQWIIGYDNEGRPCHYMNPAKQNTQRSERQIEHLVFLLERDLDLLPPGQETLTLLINFGETARGQGASLGQGKQTLYILQNHYPERLGRALLCNIPWYISAFLKLVGPFIDPETKKKIVYEKDMRDYVPAEQLCKPYGGDLDFDYDHGTYWPAMNKLAEERRASQLQRWVKGGKLVGEFELYLKGAQEVSLNDSNGFQSTDRDVEALSKRAQNLDVDDQTSDGFVTPPSEPQ